MRACVSVPLLLAGLAASPPLWAAPRPADGRLVYLQRVDDHCRIGIWESKTRTSRIVGTVPACPGAVSVTSQERVLVLMYPKAIRVVDIASGSIGEMIPMPADALGKGLDTEMSLAGYTPDGTLAMRLRGTNSAQEGSVQLFLYKDGSWKKTAEKPCRDDDECAVQPAIEARPLDDIYGIGPNGLFNPSLTDDPYVVSRSSKDGDPETASGEVGPPDEHMRPAEVILAFHVNGKDSRLRFDTVPGEDTDGIYTFRLKLMLPDGQIRPITKDQFGAALVGHYLFFHGFFGNGVRLYDVSNGEVVMDDLATGGWLETALPK